MQVSFIDMVLLPMHRSLDDIIPGCAALVEGLEANRALWEGLAECGDNHAVIEAPEGGELELHVHGGQAIDSMFDECAPAACAC
jgi:hypothetical protein